MRFQKAESLRSGDGAAEFERHGTNPQIPFVNVPDITRHRTPVVLSSVPFAHVADRTESAYDPFGNSGT